EAEVIIGDLMRRAARPRSAEHDGGDAVDIGKPRNDPLQKQVSLHAVFLDLCGSCGTAKLWHCGNTRTGFAQSWRPSHHLPPFRLDWLSRFDAAGDGGRFSWLPSTVPVLRRLELRPASLPWASMSPGPTCLATSFGASP